MCGAIPFPTPQLAFPVCRALDVLPLRPGRSEAARKLPASKPQRHKPDAAKGSAPKGPVQPIGPANSKRAPAKRRRSAQEEEGSALVEGSPACSAMLISVSFEGVG